VLYFTHLTPGAYKVLGLRFCLGEEGGGECVDIERNPLNKNVNGWWDDVEELFYK
jgi:hypothetical protein